MLRPPDVLVLLALIAEEEPTTLRGLAARLGVQHSKVQRALDRLAEARIYDPERRRVVSAAAEEFLLHALKYLQPLREGPVQRGVPTAWGVSPLAAELVGGEEPPPVWASPKGTVRGPSVEPLDPVVPDLVERWPEVAELAALADGVRLGDVRTRKAAAEYIRRRLSAR